MDRRRQLARLLIALGSCGPCGCQSVNPASTNSATTDRLHDVQREGAVHAAASTSGTTTPGEERPPTRIVIDSMIGQINGEPIFANDILTPLSVEIADLRSQVASASISRIRYQENVMLLLATSLRNVLTNAILLAEAEHALTEVQRQAYAGFIRHITEEVTAERGGTRGDVALQIEAEENLSLDAYVRDIRDSEMKRSLLREKVFRQVIISWRDIEQAYSARYDEFNIAAKATITRIRVIGEPSSDGVIDVARRLDAGEEFSAIAGDLRVDDGGTWQTFELPGGDITFTQFTDEGLERAVHSLKSVGDTAGPIIIGNTVWWVQLADVHPAVERSIYDASVQRELVDRIRETRSSIEQQDYIDSLLDRSIYDEFDRMVEQLYFIVQSRQQAGQPG